MPSLAASSRLVPSLKRASHSSAESKIGSELSSGWGVATFIIAILTQVTPCGEQDSDVDGDGDDEGSNAWDWC